MNLWSHNTPDRFWRCEPNPPAALWQEAVQNSSSILGISPLPQDVEALLAATLGEGLIGPHPWRLSPPRWLYYQFKPVLPRALINGLKTASSHTAMNAFPLGWPVEDRFARFLWEVLRQVLILSGQSSIAFRSLWPEGRRSALVLTHDIESAAGLTFVPQVADLEERHGFRSSFNLVPEGYKIDMGLVRDLRSRGFEVGIHGLKHDGKDFESRKTFERRVKRINQYIRQYESKGFRAPLMHRQPYWMQALDVEYDLSFFDTDPYEPMPGGVMTPWPFFLGKFVELPYTLVQDSTLGEVLGEKTPRIWLEKLNYLRMVRGMALINTHPDYLPSKHIWKLYTGFLEALCERREDFWHALPHEVAAWWRLRAHEQAVSPQITFDRAALQGTGLCLEGSDCVFIDSFDTINHHSFVINGRTS